MEYAALFPGQGSQYVGMGAGLFELRPDLLGAAADDVLGWSLRDVCLGGPEAELTRTDRAQPALYALAYALWELWRGEAAGLPAAAAGHSLGEYTALAAAGAMDYFAGLHLVAARGRAMAQAAARQPSGMAALIGVDADAAERILAGLRDDGAQLWVANINAPGQIVVAGGAADIARLGADARSLGIRRVVPLKVTGAFHSPFMEPAVEEFAAVLGSVGFAEPRFPVLANATAAPVTAAEIADSLARQLTSPVRFVETLERMAGTGIGWFVHIGPGDVTAGLVRRTLPDAVAHAAGAPDEVSDVAAAVSIQ
jgi:malonyl CoA-acyl carrier protein transacylase